MGALYLSFKAASMLEIVIRDMRAGEEHKLWQLFHDTIHRVNTSDYGPEQIEAWSPADRDPTQWAERMQKVAPFCAVMADEIVGFSDLQADGLVDFMFVHHAYQGQGVANALMAEIKRRAAKRGIAELYAHVSITAKPFFARHGFRVVAEQTVRMGEGEDEVVLQNYLMRTQ